MWNELVLIRIHSLLGSVKREWSTTSWLFDLAFAFGLRYRYSVLFQQEYNFFLSHDLFSLSLSLSYIAWYWTLDIEPLILSLDIDPWYWTLILTLIIEPWLEPLIMTWPLVHDIEPWTLDPSVFYPGATCCGVATTIALMHQCYVL